MVQEIQRKGWQINLWRWLQDENLKKWNDICISAQRYTLAQEAHDQIKWKCVCVWGGGGVQKQFSVKTLYNHVDTNNYGTHMKHIWKSEVPPKIKMFMCFFGKQIFVNQG
jgi:hypothetical protein